MAYADQKMSSNRLIALIAVALLHILLAYGLVSGLAYEGVTKVIKRVTTVDIKEEVKEEEVPPPPPPEKTEVVPPPVAPPVKIDVAVRPPVIETVSVAPPAPPAVVLAPPAAVAPPPPPPPPAAPAKPASPRNDPASWATPNDYPSRALREEKTGTTTFRVKIGEDGRVASCSIVSSSGDAELDDATCKNVTRRARFRKPSEGYQDTYTNRVRWVIPD